MAVDMRERGTVGCSYYVAAEEKLHFMEDVKLGGIEVVDNRKRTDLPSATAMLTSSSKACHQSYGHPHVYQI